MVLCPALLGPRARPFLFSKDIALEQWSETFFVREHSLKAVLPTGSLMGARAPSLLNLLNNLLETLGGSRPVHRSVGHFSGCDGF